MPRTVTTSSHAEMSSSTATASSLTTHDGSDRGAPTTSSSALLPRYVRRRSTSDSPHPDHLRPPRPRPRVRHYETDAAAAPVDYGVDDPSFLPEQPDAGAQEPDATVDDDSYYTGGAYYYVQAADDDQE